MKSFVPDPNQDKILVNLPNTIAGGLAIITVALVTLGFVTLNLKSAKLTAQYSSSAALKKSADASLSYQNSSISSHSNLLVDPEGLPIPPSSSMSK